MAEPDGWELAPHYYRDNFLRLCDTVERQYEDLLAGPERLLLQRFHQLDFRAQCLYVRLVSRVGPWFRESRLAYAELGELGPVLDALVAQDLAFCARELSTQELGRLFTKDELLRAFAVQLSKPAPADKASLLAAIDDLSLAPARLLQELAAAEPGRIVALWGVAEVEVLQLLFFGNRRQSLTEFVLSDLGVARYYPYALNRDDRLFQHRPALDEYLQCAAFSDAWYEIRDVGDPRDMLALARQMLATETRFPSSENRWHRLCNSVARELERIGEDTVAQELYQCSRRHPARERRARLLERAGDWSGCATLCDEILSGPWCEEEGEAASRILPRVRRKLYGTRASRHRDQFPQVRLTLARGEEPVEQLVAAHVAPRWRAVHYVENKLMSALFGLAFWEQIFAPVPGAFHNAYQSIPTDMYESGFRIRRREALAARLAQLRPGGLAAELGDAYRKYHGYQCRWVDWRCLDADLLERAASIIPAEHLLAIWERMLFDPRENRRGFPDLIALGDTAGDYRMIEVKGPGDALQDSQRRWLRFFMAQNIPAEVAWVEWRDD